MDMQSIFALLSFLLSLGAYIPYVRAALKSKAEPTISVWVSWAIVDATIFSGMLAKGIIAWQIVAYVFGVFNVIGANLWRAGLGAILRQHRGFKRFRFFAAELWRLLTKDWGALDSVCFGIVVLAMVLWIHSGNAETAIVIALIATVIGTIPMFPKIWREPTREPTLPWLLITAGGTAAVLAIREWTIAEALTPCCFLVLQIVVVSLVTRNLIIQKLTLLAKKFRNVAA